MISAFMDGQGGRRAAQRGKLVALDVHLHHGAAAAFQQAVDGDDRQRDPAVRIRRQDMVHPALVRGEPEHAGLLADAQVARVHTAVDPVETDVAGEIGEGHGHRLDGGWNRGRARRRAARSRTVCRSAAAPRSTRHSEARRAPAARRSPGAA
jgi:hypothetical protein